MDELSDRMRQLARWITARLVSMSIHGATLDCIDHLLEQMHHLHTQQTGKNNFTFSYFFLIKTKFHFDEPKKGKSFGCRGLVKALENR
jgi:hypothetical protein